MKIFGSIKELVSTVFRQNGKEIVLKPNTASYASLTAPIVELPPPDEGTVELVGKTSSQTLTNKTIDDDTNTIQNLALGAIKTVLADADKALVRDAAGAVTSAKVINVNVADAAAIAYSKLALSNSIVNADISSSAAIADTKLATISTAGKVSNSATTATAANTASTIVARASDNSFAAGAITATSFSGPLTSSAISGATAISYAVTTANADSTITPAADRPIILLNNLVTSTINSVANPATGKQLFLVNDGLTDLTINDNNGGTTGIFTGTGSAFTLKTNASVSLLYNSSQNRWVLSGGAGGSGGGTLLSVSQSTTGLAVGDVMYLSGTNFTRAKADTVPTAEVVGVVSKILDGSSYELTLAGEVSKAGWGLTPGEAYFLSPTTAGAITTAEPTTIGHVSVPIGVARTSTTLIVAPKRGAVVGGTNARTQLSLASGTTTSVLNVSAYEAGEITGWVTINATTSYRFGIKIQFTKNIAGSDYYVSYQTTGDTPPAGFSVGYTSPSVTITMPSPAGFSSANINYALNAPAVGATFPLEISALRITQDTIAAARLPVVVPGTSAGVVAAAGLPGNTTGNDIASGYVGEVRRVTASSAVALVGSNTTTVISDTLPAGIWLCTVSIITTVTANSALVYHNISKSNALLNEKKVTTASGTGDRQFSTFTEVIKSSGADTVQGRVQATGAVTGSSIDAASEESVIVSVRIA